MFSCALIVTLAGLFTAPLARAAAAAFEPVTGPPPAPIALQVFSPAPAAAPSGTVVVGDPAIPGPVVVHFFASWCEPCRRELPALTRLSRRLAGSGVQVVLVAVADVEARLDRLFQDLEAPGPILMDRRRAAARAFQVDVLPTSLVLVGGVPKLSAAGEVAWDEAPVEDLLRRLAGENARLSSDSSQPPDAGPAVPNQ